MLSLEQIIILYTPFPLCNPRSGGAACNTFLFPILWNRPFLWGQPDPWPACILMLISCSSFQQFSFYSGKPPLRGSSQPGPMAECTLMTGRTSGLQQHHATNISSNSSNSTNCFSCSSNKPIAAAATQHAEGCTCSPAQRNGDAEVFQRQQQQLQQQQHLQEQ